MKVVERPAVRSTGRRIVLGLSVLVLAAAVLLMLTDPAGTPSGPRRHGATSTAPITCNSEGTCTIPPISTIRSAP